MRRVGLLFGYWVGACIAAMALFGAGLAYAQLLEPLGRVLLVPDEGCQTNLRPGRKWVEAAVLTLVWAAVPWVLAALVEPRLRAAGVELPWAPDPNIGGPVLWWWAGVACYFGLLYRRFRAGLAGGALALGCQWVLFSHWLGDLVRLTGAPDRIAGYLIYGLGLGLALALADVFAQAGSGRR